MNFKLSVLVASIISAGGTAIAEQNLPLREMDGIADREHWLPGEVNQDGALEALQAATAETAKPYAGTLDKPLQIALIIEKLAKNDDLTTFVWAFHTPLKYFEKQPAGWVDFSSAYGALKICDYMVERLGNDVTYAMNRGIPGITDNQRSGDFKECVAKNGNWNVVYEHYGEYQREGGFEGTSLILQGYPEAKVIHNANTAMSMGSVEAQKAVDKEGEIFSTGWGGTGLELDAIRNKELDATPMRMGDDVGAATAEAIKAHLENRAAELPLVFLGRITVAHDQMSNEEIDNLEKEAFRFSGVGALDR